ncbi:phospholipase D-like domain-containing protein [Perlucidibaca aquatica]|uniref:phospholipase D-like domain-containing protein n=1 Tax=Perlucidibaca aquatica TaxID=1852776 RepID=UPI0009EE64FC|nr:phospholipase D-like domain-containing protein [Perlucidibaca aquatica]
MTFFGPNSLATFLATATFVITGCASLPDVESAQNRRTNSEVIFSTAQGQVSVADAKTALRKLKGKNSDSDILARHLAYEQAVNIDNPLVLGNRLSLLQNGPNTYRAMFKAIRSAKHHINLETYIFDDDDIGRQFSALLLERQAAGVQVNIIHDSFGTVMTPAAFFDRLREGGINVLAFNPLNPLTSNQREWRLNNRDHRRQLIIDGAVAFTGGVNISESYSSAPSGHMPKAKQRTANHTTSWRDTHIRIEGPVVAEFQKLFMASWERQRGPALRSKNYFPELKPRGNEIVRVIGSTPDDALNPIYLTLMSAIRHAEKNISLTIAYFAPDSQLLEALGAAAKRGVTVQLILPSHTDSWAIHQLGRSHYTALLRVGVRLYERRGAIMHAKTACIDDVWSTVGSTNLDWRSFLHNDEINAVILSRDFAQQMNVMFAEDLAASDEILLKQWQRRSWLLRLQEQLARLGSYWL